MQQQQQQKALQHQQQQHQQQQQQHIEDQILSFMKANPAIMTKLAASPVPPQMTLQPPVSPRCPSPSLVQPNLLQTHPPVSSHAPSPISEYLAVIRPLFCNIAHLFRSSPKAHLYKLASICVISSLSSFLPTVLFI